MEKRNVKTENSSLFFFERGATAGNMPDMHTHSSYEIFYLTNGTRKYFINDKYFLINAGDVVCIPPNAPHKTGGETGQRFLINFKRGFLSKYLTPEAEALLLSFFDKLFLRPTRESEGALLDAFATVERAYNSDDEGALINSLFKLFVILSDAPQIVDEESASIAQLNLAMQYVKENYEHIRGLDDVAVALFISKFYLCRLFSKHLEISFNDYLTQTRLEAAKKYLKDTDKSVSDVSLKCGFNSPSYFGSVFKKTFNLTPLSYRKLHQKGKG